MIMVVWFYIFIKGVTANKTKKKVTETKEISNEARQLQPIATTNKEKAYEGGDDYERVNTTFKSTQTHHNSYYNTMRDRVSGDNKCFWKNI